MTKLIGKLNEQGYTNFRTSLHRIRLISVVAAGVALVSLYPLHEYRVRANFSPLQSEYYGQYLHSSLMFSRSRYRYLAATITDSKTGRDREIAVTNSDMTSVRDAQGQVIVKNRSPLFQVRNDLDPQGTLKGLHWTKQKLTDKQANEWFRDAIFEGNTLTVLWRPAWFWALIIFLVGSVGATVFYHVFQRRFVQGQQLRGTRELSPKQYQKEHRKHTGYRLKVYPQQLDKLKEFLGLNPPLYL